MALAPGLGWLQSLGQVAPLSPPARALFVESLLPLEHQAGHGFSGSSESPRWEPPKAPGMGLEMKRAHPLVAVVEKVPQEHRTASLRAVRKPSLPLRIIPYIFTY